MTRDELIGVFKDTTQRVEDGDYNSDLNCFKSTFSKKDFIIKGLKSGNIEVVNEDCIKVADRLSKFGKTCILNMASYKKPGGGVKTGAMAQEEELARRSNLMWGLPQDFYPLSMDEYIYTKGVTFFKDNEYGVIPEFNSDVITISAININNHDKPDGYEDIMASKITTMLSIPNQNGCRNIVLSAFGCGVFKNDPTFLSNLFLKYLKDGYSSLYDTVSFAILNDRNSVGSNFEIFKDILT
jgi:uncharacterized protein (TIGR02452 family)